MANNTLIIDFAKDSVNAGIFSSKGIDPVDFFTAHIIDGDFKKPLSSILKAVAEKGYKDFSKVFIGISPKEISMRIINLPFIDKKKIQDVLPFEVKDLLPKNMDDMIIDAVSLADSKTLAIAVEKKTIQGYLSLLKDFLIDPTWIGASLFSRYKLLEGISGKDEAAALIDNESIIVCKNGAPYLFKELKDVADMKLVIANILLEGVNIFYTIGKLNHDTKEVINKEKDNIRVAPLPNQILNQSPAMTGIIALSMHFRDGFKETVNFRKGEFRYTKDVRALKKGLMVSTALIITLTIFWGIHIYLKYKTISNEINALKYSIDAAYRQIFPKESIIDALYQLETKLKILKDEKMIIAGDIKVLDVMRELSNSADKGAKIKLYEIDIEGSKITVKGHADSFEGTNRFKDSIKKNPSFKEVFLTDVKMQTSGMVGFSLSIVTKETNDF